MRPMLAKLNFVHFTSWMRQCRKVSSIDRFRLTRSGSRPFLLPDFLSELSVNSALAQRRYRALS